MERAYDMAEMLRAAENRNSYKKGFQNWNNVPNCINTDYCKPTPTDKNDGILTMAFVDMQTIDSVYQTDTAFCKGTLFPNIDKPFYGGMKE